MLFIKLILKPGVFLYLKEYQSAQTWVMTTQKDQALQLSSRDDAENLIGDLMCATHWKYNFELSNY